MKALIADDHVLIREGIKHTLQEQFKDIVVLQAENGQAVETITAGHKDFDFILLDLMMPDTDGFALLSKLCDTLPDSPVVILSASEKHSHMRKALDLGAAGFIPKSTPYDVMIQALQLVLSGGVYIPPDMLKPETRIDNPAGESHYIMPEEEREKILSSLTNRQKEVLLLMSKGCQNKEIARLLGISEHTIKIHVTAILKALGVSNRTQVVIAVQEMGL